MFACFRFLIVDSVFESIMWCDVMWYGLANIIEVNHEVMFGAWKGLHYRFFRFRFCCAKSKKLLPLPYRYYGCSNRIYICSGQHATFSTIYASGWTYERFIPLRKLFASRIQYHAHTHSMDSQMKTIVVAFAQDIFGFSLFFLAITIEHENGYFSKMENYRFRDVICWLAKRNSQPLYFGNNFCNFIKLLPFIHVYEVA